jgi:hypothetical protein
LEKYKPTVLPHSSKVFNSVIHSLALRKSIWRLLFTLGLINKGTLHLRKLIGFYRLYWLRRHVSLVKITKVVKDQSDHNLLILDSGESPIYS